ncbi:MAG: CAP domain-containing protein [Defluviitaleaceae bacterium]|nr:CAP domain-containing protein [Defluviitaleaceae bacterium]
MNFLFCMLMIFSFSGAETDLIAEINNAREISGVQKLSVNRELMRLARYKSEEMVELNFFGHSSRIYGEPEEMLARFGVNFSKAGATIAKGQETAQEVVRAWLTSQSHVEVLFDAEFTSAGVGLAFDDGIPYWTLFLISSA